MIDLSLLSADTVTHNSHVLFNKQYLMCSNDILVWSVK